MSTRTCYGVIVSYALDCADKATVCRRNKIDMFASDDRLTAVAGAAVPWIGAYVRKTGGVDTGAGPFCFDPKRACRVPRRDLEFDTISLRRGMTKAEAEKLAQAVRRVGARANVRPDKCRLPPIDGPLKT